MNISRLKCGLKPQRNSVIFFIIVDFNIGCNSRWSTQNDKFRLCKNFPTAQKRCSLSTAPYICCYSFPDIL